MNVDAVQLPDSTEELEALLEQTRFELQQQHESEVRLLREEINILKQKLFGRRSEKLTVGNGQLSLFNEAEQQAGLSTKEPSEIEVPGHRRRKAGRKPLPEDLPRVEVVHDLPEEQKRCCCGCEKVRIGEEISEQLDIIAPKVQVIRNIRYKYVCKNCEGTEADEPAVSIASLPEQIIPKSIATPGLLAYIISAKFVDGLPFYRQHMGLERYGVDVSRQTLCSWAIKVAEKCGPLLKLMRDEILSSPVINADETTVQVLQEPGRAATTKSYMWLFRGGTLESPVILYQYHMSRSSRVAKDFLHGYRGYVQTDGYLGYDFLEYEPEIRHLGCWAHVRRKFVEVVNAADKTPKKGPRKPGSGDLALDYIGKLYRIEKEIQELNPEQIYTQRQQRAGPILVKFKKWLDKRALQVPPKSTLGKAIAYTLGQWDRLAVYLADGRLHPDNNLAENAIRPFVVGRKNWLFSATPAGAHASAALYSIIETAKANGLEPYWYLRYLFERLPAAKTEADHKALLPQYVDINQIGRSS